MFLFPGRADRLSLALVALCCATGADAQQRLTAAEAVARAMANEQLQLEWRTGVALARGDLTRARTLPNPSLVVSREDLVEAAVTTGEETSVMISQPLELGGQRAARIRAAEATVVASEAAALRDQQAFRREVLRAYYGSVAAEQIRDARIKGLAALESLAAIATKRLAAGDLSGYEARRIRQATEHARVAHAEAEAAVHAARAVLATWVGAPAATAVLDDVIVLPDLPGDAEPSHAGLDVLAAERAQAEATLQAAGGVSLPITLGIGRKRIRQGGWSDDALMLEVGLELPFFDRRQGERAQARAALSLAEARLQREQLLLSAQRAALLDQARLRSDSAKRIAAQLLPEATRLTAIAEASFAEGELELLALLDAYDTEATLVEKGLDDQLRALDAALALEALMPARKP